MERIVLRLYCQLLESSLKSGRPQFRWVMRTCLPITPIQAIEGDPILLERHRR